MGVHEAFVSPAPGSAALGGERNRARDGAANPARQRQASRVMPCWAKYILRFVVAGGMAVTTAATACDVSGPAMLDLYMTGRTAAATDRTIIERSAAAGTLTSALTLDATVNALNTEIWGIYWLVLYSRRLHEVLEQVDPARELPSQSLITGTVRGYYSRWDAAQLTATATRVVHAAGQVVTALDRAESAGGTTILPTEAARLRQFAARAVNELQGCAKPR